MTKAVFTTKPESSYDDLPERRYHFPRTYLRQVEAAARDWIVYYEPRRRSAAPSSRGGQQAYFAVARVDSVTADPAVPDHFYANMSDYLPFDQAVPFRDGDAFRESGLRRSDGEVSKGAFGRAVRPLPEAEFELILRAGFAHIIDTPAANEGGLSDPPAAFERPIIERIVARPFRERAFVEAVRAAYAQTCAVTGLRIINGGGRPEVQASHIRPVASDGPDSVRNGLALCATAHWMFDRGLITVTDDYRLRVAADSLSEKTRGLFRPDGRVTVPAAPALRPHPTFLEFHRKCVFKG